jgi:hypothetical protein
MALAKPLNESDMSASVSLTSSEDAAALATRGGTVFSEITDRLNTLRARVMATDEDLRGLAALADGGADPDAIPRLAQSAAAAADALRATLEPDTARAALTEAERAKGYLHAVDRAGRTLAAISTLTRATAGSFGVLTLAGYLKELAAISTAMRESVGVARARISAITAGDGRLREGARAAVEALGRMDAAIAEAETMTEGLREQEAAAADAVVAEAEALRARGKTQLKAFIGVVQFSDRLSQRMDHLGAMLAVDDPQVRRLAAAHLAAIAEAVREIAAEVDAAAVEIGAVGEAGGTLFLAGEIADAIRASVDTRAEAADAVGRDMAHVDAALAETRNGVAATDDAVAAAQARFAALVDCARRVTTASINSSLLAARAGAASGPLTTLSSEVRAVAAQCLAAVGGCQAALNSLGRAEADARTAVVQALDGLGGALSAVRGAVAAGASRLSDLSDLGARAAVRLADMKADAATLADGGARLRSLAEEMAAASATMAQGVVADGASDPAALTAIWDLYTMDDERAVHAALFGGFDAAHASSDDIDDMFF